MMHGHGHDHHGHHGHANDRGVRGALRYLRWLPEMRRSEINDAVVAEIDPQPGERVVDIGAGLGAGAVRAAAAGAYVVAVEPTPYMRRALRVRRAVNRHRRNILVVDGAAERMPVEDDGVDAVWAVNTMHHWVDVERSVSEIARALRAGGRVLLVDEVFTDPTHPDFERFGAEHGPEHHGFTSVDADRMRELLSHAGLSDVEASDRRLGDRPVISVSARGPRRPGDRSRR